MDVVNRLCYSYPNDLSSPFCQVQSLMRDEMQRVFETYVGPKETGSFSRFELVDCSKKVCNELLNTDDDSTNLSLAETRRVFENLKQLHAPTAEDIYIKDDTGRGAPFRLLCEMSRRRNLRSRPPIDSYVALSYCWHSPAWQV